MVLLYGVDMSVEDQYPLMYGKSQNWELCKAAVHRKPSDILYIHSTALPLERYRDLCLYAVKQDGLLLRWIYFATPEIVDAALHQNPEALKYVSQTPELCLFAYTIAKSLDVLNSASKDREALTHALCTFLMIAHKTYVVAVSAMQCMASLRALDLSASLMIEVAAEIVTSKRFPFLLGLHHRNAVDELSPYISLGKLWTIAVMVRRSGLNCSFCARDNN